MPLQSTPHTRQVVEEQGLLQEPRWAHRFDRQASDCSTTASRNLRAEVKQSKVIGNRRTSRTSQSMERSDKITLDQSMDYQS